VAPLMLPMQSASGAKWRRSRPQRPFNATRASRRQMRETVARAGWRPARVDARRSRGARPARRQHQAASAPTAGAALARRTAARARSSWRSTVRLFIRAARRSHGSCAPHVQRQDGALARRQGRDNPERVRRQYPGQVAPQLLPETVVDRAVTAGDHPYVRPARQGGGVGRHPVRSSAGADGTRGGKALSRSNRRRGCARRTAKPRRA